MSKNQNEEKLTLYRKYRPQDFSEVVGQEHITEVLKGEIENGRLAHAYLFCGSRGTGKTSVARILAHAVGCAGSDLYEIDAASYTGVDNIRELNENISTLPFESKYKVYIFDEVHMLSKGAFNAFLKTLEEPPAHVIFILATTEFGKVPETIVSRCQTFIFKKPSQKMLKTVVLNIAKKEGFTLEPAAADLVAFLADGSFRDAQSILQKIISSSADKKISLEEISLVTGAPRAGLVNDLLTAIEKKDLVAGLNTIEQVFANNIDGEVYLKLLLQKIRFTLMLRNAPALTATIKEQLPEEDFAFLKDLADTGKNINSALLSQALDTAHTLATSSWPQMILELLVLKLIGEQK